MTKEKHHIVPKCEGGLDSPDNYIYLSSTAHAIISVYQSEFYNRPCVHPRQYKYLPEELKSKAKVWLDEARRRSGEITRQKALNDPSYRSKLGEQGRKNFVNLWGNAETYFQMLEHSRASQPLAREAARSPEARKKRKETFKEINHQKGSKNSQFGTMWITNGVTNKKISKESPIPEGYWKGRTLQ